MSKFSVFIHLHNILGMNRRKAMFDVKCSGDELKLQYCHYKNETNGRCRYYEMASVECAECMFTL